jgi:hypothetical protein
MMRSSVLACVLAFVACGGSNGNNNNGPDAGSNGSNGSNTSCTPSGASATGTAGGGTVPYAIPLTDPDGPVSFYAPMLTVGGQMFAMDLDTGSTTTAIAGTSCKDCSGSDFTMSPEYAPTATATDECVKADSEFADGTGWYGEVFRDTIGVGNSSPTATLKIVDISTQVDPNDPMAMAGFFQDNSYQGILGMGAPENEVDHTEAFFSTIVGTGMPNVMSFEMCSDGGTMWLGGTDPTHYSGTMQYAALDPIDLMNNPFYSVDLTSVSFNGKTVTPTSAADLTEWVVDTGTSLFYVPTEFFNAVAGTQDMTTGKVTGGVMATTAWKNLFGTGSFFTSQDGCVTATDTTVSDATINSMLPPFVMKMKGAAGGADITVSAPALASYLVDAGQGQFCFVMGDGGNEATMGDEVMQGFVVVIDQTNKQVGWAPDTGCASAMPRPRDMTKRFHGPKPHGPRRVTH